MQTKAKAPLASESTLGLIAIPRDSSPLVLGAAILIEVGVLGSVIKVSVRVVAVGMDAIRN